MTKGFTIESIDIQKLEQTFADLQYLDQKKITTDAFKKALKPTVSQAKNNINNYTGHLRMSVGTMAARDEVAVIIGARRRFGYKGYHGFIVEEGTVDRWAKTWRGQPLKKKRFTGKMNAGKPYAFWLKRAVDATENQVNNSVSDDWYESILRFHKKNGLK